MSATAAGNQGPGAAPPCQGFLGQGRLYTNRGLQHGKFRVGLVAVVDIVLLLRNI